MLARADFRRGILEEVSLIVTGITGSLRTIDTRWPCSTTRSQVDVIILMSSHGSGTGQLGLRYGDG